MVYNICVFISDHLIRLRVSTWRSHFFELLCGVLYGLSSHTVHYVPNMFKLKL